MALIQEYDKFAITKTGKLHKTQKTMNLCSCDVCNIEFEQRKCDTIKRRKFKLANGRDLCAACSKQESANHIAAIGTITLAKRSTEQIREHARIGGIASSKSDTANSGRFSTERWNSMSSEEQYVQVTRANNTLQEKLKCPIYSEKHYSKIYSQSKIGYIYLKHTENYTMKYQILDLKVMHK